MLIVAGIMACFVNQDLTRILLHVRKSDVAYLVAVTEKLDGRACYGLARWQPSAEADLTVVLS